MGYMAYYINTYVIFFPLNWVMTWITIFHSILVLFLALAGYNIRYLQRTKASPLELARKQFPRPTKSELSEALTNSLSFLIVREPFERLLSAYRNKLEGYRNKYYRILGEQIVRKYRKGGKRVS